MRTTARGRLRRLALVPGVLALVAGTLGTSVAVAETPSSPPTATPTPTASTVPTPGAASTSYRLRSDAFGLALSPARVVVSPQDVTKAQQVTAVNQGQSPLDVTVQKRDFVQQPDGSLRWQDDAPYGASSWMTVSPKRFTLAPGAAQVVTADIDMPAEPDLGDHQAALVFLVPPTAAQGNVRLNRGIGAPVLITVPGPVDDSVAVRSLHARGFSWTRDVPLRATVESTGTVHRDFRGAGALSVTSGGSATRLPDFTVGRGSLRDVDVVWRAPLLCLCHPTLTVPGGVPATAATRVLVFPWYLAVGVLAGLLLALGVVVRRRHLRQTRPDLGGAAAATTGAGEDNTP